SYLVQLRPVAQSANFNTGIRNSGISGPPVPTYRDAASGDVTRSREEPRNGNGFGPSHTDSAAWLNLRCRSALAVHVEVVHRCGRYALRVNRFVHGHMQNVVGRSRLAKQKPVIGVSVDHRERRSCVEVVTLVLVAHVLD